jgi:hypothetical protein
VKTAGLFSFWASPSELEARDYSGCAQLARRRVRLRRFSVTMLACVARCRRRKKSGDELRSGSQHSALASSIMPNTKRGKP